VIKLDLSHHSSSELPQGIKVRLECSSIDAPILSLVVFNESESSILSNTRTNHRCRTSAEVIDSWRSLAQACPGKPRSIAGGASDRLERSAG